MNKKNNRYPIRTIILIAAIAVLFLGAISITSVAAQSSIPGDALYPVKSTIEQTRLSFSRDAGVRAQLRMSYAEQRLDEIASLIEEGRFREVGRAVLAFEADINSAILELENLSETDPLRAPQIAREITSALTRYAQILSVMAANAPDAVKQEVTRALDTTQIAGSLELPVQGVPTTGNENANGNGNENTSVDNGNANSNQNTNNDDNGNLNTNINTNQNTNDDNGNFNANINTNQNINDDNGNGDAENFNSNTNTNLNTNQNTNNALGNDNGDDSNSNTNTNQNTNDDSGNGNGNSNSNDNSDDDSDENDNDKYGDGEY
ncbi:MAG: hypothetical protein EHM41_20455 [Chloroflexi bacterium]|nr:MAG: hypothetical protein EHM41_20455 [Chloroflexota bacterium]